MHCAPPLPCKTANFLSCNTTNKKNKKTNTFISFLSLGGSQNLKKKVCVLPLKEIAEEVASVLEYECPHVTSLVCPSLNLHDAKRAEKISLCQLGVPADERKLACSRAVQQRATRKVMHELMGAKRSLPSLCQGEMKQVLCTRSNDARRWMSCMFLSGGHGAELPVGQVPVHDSL